LQLTFSDLPDLLLNLIELMAKVGEAAHQLSLLLLCCYAFGTLFFHSYLCRRSATATPTATMLVRISIEG
jgi:hypothetical protein